MTALLLPDGRTVRRIQLRRTKGWKKPEGAVVVGRGRYNRWGNPWKATPALGFTVEDAVAVYRDVVRVGRADWRDLIITWPNDYRHPQPTLDDILQHLAGRDLACWCPLDAPCHADVLLKLANPDAVEVTPVAE